MPCGEKSRRPDERERDAGRIAKSYESRGVPNRRRNRNTERQLRARGLKASARTIRSGGDRRSA